jgi:hypothetical protein
MNLKIIFAAVLATTLMSCTEGGLMVTDPNVSSSSDLGGSQTNLSSSGNTPGQSSETSSDGSSSSGGVSGEIPVGILPMDYSQNFNIPLKINEVSATLELGSGSCLDGGVFETNWNEINNYKISNGIMLMWATGECAAEQYSGTSSTLSGVWTSMPALALAPGSTDLGCDLTPNPFYETVSLDFSSTFVAAAFSTLDWCWSTEQIDGLYTYGTTAATGCNSYSVTELGETATFTLLSIDPSAGSKKQSFTYNGQTCTLNSPAMVLNATTCSQAWAAHQASTSSSDEFFWDEWVGTAERTAYEECVLATGWAGDTGL